jgi:hypothetical protein
MSAAAGAGSVPATVKDRVAAMAIVVDPATRVAFDAFLHEAQRRAEERAWAVEVASPSDADVGPQVDRLVSAIAAGSANGVLTNAAFANLRLQLCPGFWPFC